MPRLKILIVLILSFCSLNLFAAETAAVTLLPGDAPIVIRIPDGAAIAKAVGESDFGKLYTEPESQQFISPALEEVKSRYTELRKGQPFFPEVADLQKVFAGELAIGVFPFEADKPTIWPLGTSKLM